MKLTTLMVVAALIAAPAGADWSLDNGDSRLSFISVKKGTVAEVHRFRNLSGTVSGNGDVAVTIQLASVDTAVPIRDERMREMLFQTGVFPTAELTAKVDMGTLKRIPVGGLSVQTVPARLNLHGESADVSLDVVIARLSRDRLIVTSQRPVIVDARSFDLAKGVDALRDVVNLPSISYAVPVSFVLSFESGG